MSSTAETVDQDVTRCNAFLEHARNKDPTVRFMMAQLSRAGCGLADAAVSCKKCDGQLAGGFQDDGTVVLCANHVTTQDHASTTLIHEAVHAFDQCRQRSTGGTAFIMPAVKFGLLHSPETALLDAKCC